MTMWPVAFRMASRFHPTSNMVSVASSRMGLDSRREHANSVKPLCLERHAGVGDRNCVTGTGHIVGNRCPGCRAQAVTDLHSVSLADQAREADHEAIAAAEGAGQRESGVR